MDARGGDGSDETVNPFNSEENVETAEGATAPESATPAVKASPESEASAEAVAEASAAAEAPDTGGVAAEAKAAPGPEAEPAAEPVAEAVVSEAADSADAEAEVSEPAADESAPAEEGEAAPEPVGVPGLDWYIIHTYSGFENKVKESLTTRADAFGYSDRIGEILIPTEDVVEMKQGKKATTKRLLYPGYVLLQLNLDDEVWHVVKNTPRVTGFVGGGQQPAPLTADEVNQILYRQSASVERPRPKMSFERNDRVKIVDGPFSNFSGAVEEVNEDRSTLKVMVTIFGRGTPVELEYFQVEKEG